MAETPVTENAARAFTVPTDAPESDGTLEWDSTTLVVVTVTGGGETGIGYTYSDPAAAALIRVKLAGIVSMAVAAVDTALWDLKASFCAFRWPAFWAAPGTVSRSTAPAGSPAMTTGSSPNSSPAGPRKAS